MDADEFLSDIDKSSRPTPNIAGNFDCMECREPVDEAYHDVRNQQIRWWCSKGHESVMKEVTL